MKFLIFFFIPILSLAQPKITLKSDFENGNGRLVYRNHDENTMVVRPQLKNGDRIEIWFNAKVAGFKKDTLLTIKIPYLWPALAPDPILVRDGEEWKRIAATDHGFYKEYRLVPKGDTIQIATGIPYTYTQLNEYLDKIRQHAFVETSVLTQTEKGREVPLVKITDPKSKKMKGSIFFTSRLHAFEPPASYFMEGLLTFICGESAEAKYLRKHYVIYAVPMADVDQVFEGGTGKDQLPMDFNRCWLENPPWNAVKAIQNLVVEMDEANPLTFFMDIHSPYPISHISSHYYNNYSENSEKYNRVEDFFKSYSAMEGFDLVFEKGNKPAPGLRTIRTYVDNELCKEENTPCFENLLFSITYEQSWQTKPDGTEFNIKEISKSASNMGINIASFLQKMAK